MSHVTELHNKPSTKVILVWDQQYHQRNKEWKKITCNERRILNRKQKQKQTESTLRMKPGRILHSQGGRRAKANILTVFQERERQLGEASVAYPLILAKETNLILSWFPLKAHMAIVC